MPNGSERPERPALQVFYEAVVARSAAVVRLRAGSDPQDMGAATRSLLRMTCSPSTVGLAVDAFERSTLPTPAARRCAGRRRPIPERPATQHRETT